MSFLDSVDLLSRCKVAAARDKLAADASMSDANFYSLLSEAQLGVYQDVAAHIPWAVIGAPVLLTSADGGVTYVFASTVAPTPMYVELFENLSGRLMKPCAFYDSSGDYVWEGDVIRFPGGRARSFSTGPYARIVTAPTVIDATTEPTLPLQLRMLLVPYVSALWAERGTMKDGSVFWARYQAMAFGDMSGRVGAINSMKLSNPYAGAAAYSDATGGLLTNVGNHGYTRYG